MKQSRLYFILGLILATTSCSLWDKMSLPGSSSKSAYEKFQETEGYPKIYEIYKDESLLKSANSSNTRVIVDLSDQRTQLLVNDQVAMDSPCCTGRAGKRTPTGSFRISEKIKDKRSTIFGRLYKGSKQVYGGDRRKYKGSYSKFVGSSLPYWMRITGDGIGFHYSKNVKRYPASAGCIRMPMEGVTTFYSKVKRGTKVTVQQ